jgi:hypothetical protein
LPFSMFFIFCPFALFSEDISEMAIIFYTCI